MRTALLTVLLLLCADTAFAGSHAVATRVGRTLTRAGRGCRPPACTLRSSVTGPVWALTQGTEELTTLGRVGAVQFPGNVPTAWADATTEHMAGVEELMTRLETCETDPACIARIAEDAGAESFWRRFLNRSCTLKNPVAMKNLLYGYLVHFSALGAALIAEPHDEFPFHLVANIVIMSAVWNEMGCRAELAGGIGTKPGNDASRARRFMGNYVAYMVMQPVGIGTVLVFTTVEDLFRGRDILSVEQLETIGRDALFQLGFTAIYAVPKGILFSNRLFFRWFPTIRTYLNNLTGTWLTGAAFDFSGRWIHNGIDLTIWLKAREAATGRRERPPVDVEDPPQ